MRTNIVPLTLVAILGVACGGGTDAGGSAPGGPIEVVGTDGLEFQPSTLSAAAGELTLELTAEPEVGHTFVIEGVDGDEPVVAVDAGRSATGSVELAAGSYTAYCSIPGHREAGMQASLDVTG